MKYIDADRLREELQKSKTELKVGNYYLDNSEQAVGYENALIDFESLLDTLEESDKDFEEAATEAATEVYTYTFQGMDDLIGLFKAGAEWMKVKMMEGAVEGRVISNDGISFPVSNEIHRLELIEGDKVRIIIVKED